MISDKKLERIEKTLGAEKINELNSLQDLDQAIVNSQMAIKEALEHLESNPKYQEIKENLKAVTAGVKEIKKFQNAVMEYALHLLESRGGA